MTRFRMNASALANSRFGSATFYGLSGAITSGAVQGTPIGEVTQLGYDGETYIELAVADSRVQVSGMSLQAGPTPTDHDVASSFNVSLYVVAEGGARRPVTFAVSVQPIDTEVTLTLKTTDAQRLDLSEQLVTCPDFNMVTVSNVGAVTMLPWQMQPLTPGASRAYTKGELLRYLAVSTQDATVSPAAGTLTLTFKQGDGETGATTEISVVIATSDAPNYVHEHGAKSGARCGGYDLRQIDAGPWSLVSQSTSGALEVFDSRLTFAAVAGTASNTYGTRFLINPTLGPSAYTATVSSTISGEHTISFTVVPHRYSIGPHPASIPLPTGQSGNIQLWRALRATDKNWGDEIVLEDGLYSTLDASGGQRKILFASPATQREGGPPPPVLRDDAGWITVRSKNYLGAKLADSHEFSGNTLNNPFVRFIGLNLDVGSIRFSSDVAGGPWHLSDLAFYFNKGAKSITGSPKYLNGVWGEWDRLYANDNWLDGPDARISIRAWDSEVIGNRILNSLEDSFQCAMMDRIYGSGKSKFWFNVAVDKKCPIPPGGVHTDFLQFYYTNDSLPYAVNNPGVYGHASIFGNLLMRGEGSYSSTPEVPRTYERDGQGIFCSDTNNCIPRYRIRGNVVASMMLNGILLRNSAPGSYIGHNTVIAPFDIVGEPWGSDMGNPRLVLRGELSGAVDVTNNIVSGGVTIIDDVPVTQGNNLTGVNTREAAAALFADPLTIGDLPDAPIMLAKIATIDPAHADKGATNDPLINIRQRWISPELLP